MSDIAYVDKSQAAPYDASKWNAQDANEVKNAVNTKVDKVAGKQLSTEDYSTAEKTKLSGVATGATANDTDANLKSRANHTGTQAATTIVEDSTHRFATDAEKSNWNSKANGTHTHAATDITPDATHRFVTDTEKTTWNGKQDALPSQTGNGGKVLGTDGSSLSWVAGGGGGGSVSPTVVDGDTNAVSGDGVHDYVQTEFTNKALYFSNTDFSGTGTSGDPIVANEAKVGNLASLTTTDKTSVVAAINEVKATAGGGSSVYERLAQGTFSNNASLMIPISSYKTTHKKFKLILISLKAQTSTADLRMRFSSDGTTALTGASYVAVRGDLSAFVNPQGTNTVGGVTEFTPFPNMDIAAGKYVDAEYEFQDVNNASRFPAISGWTAGWQQSVGRTRPSITAHYEVASTFLGIQLYCSTGNIVSGEWMLMGLKN